MPQGHSQRQIDLPDLPNEIWGEIARFASRESVLNLRAASVSLKTEAETAITSMTVSSSANLRAFAETRSFNHLHTLHIDHADNASLQHFVAHFSERFYSGLEPIESATHAMRDTAPRTSDPVFGLTITMRYGQGDLTDALIKLSTLPLAGLRLNNIYPLETPALAALARSRFPIEISGRFDRDKLVALSAIPTLAALHTNAMHFDEAVARLFSSHPALHSLTLGAVHYLSARSVEYLAGIRGLRKLHFEETLYPSNPISYEAAIALGANPVLHTLRIRSSNSPLSDDSFFALSRTTGIKTLEVSVGPGMRHLGNMTTLENLSLDGRSATVPLINVASARAIASLPHLRSLTFSSCRFDDATWQALLDGSHFETLQLYNQPVPANAVTALLENTSVRELTIENGWNDPSLTAALANHPTLTKLTIDGVPYAFPRCSVEAHCPV